MCRLFERRGGGVIASWRQWPWGHGKLGFVAAANVCVDKVDTYRKTQSLLSLHSSVRVGRYVDLHCAIAQIEQTCVCSIIVGASVVMSGQEGCYPYSIAHYKHHAHTGTSHHSNAGTQNHPSLVLPKLRCLTQFPIPTVREPLSNRSSMFSTPLAFTISNQHASTGSHTVSLPGKSKTRQLGVSAAIGT